MGTGARAMRQEFERAFSEAPAAARGDRGGFLRIRVGREPCAIPLAEAAELRADLRVTRLGSDHPELLGVANLRGVLAPVYRLAALLGMDAGSEPGGWCLVIRAEAPVVLSFEAFEGFEEAGRNDLISALEPGPAGVGKVLRGPGGLRRVLRTESLVALIRAVAGGAPAGRADPVVRPEPMEGT